MSAEQNKVVVRHWIEEVFGQGNMAVMEEVCAPNHMMHEPGSPDLQGIEALKQRVLTFRNAFSNLHITVEEIVAEKDSVAARWTFQGTHQSPLLGIPPTGRYVTAQEITLHRLAGGKIIESWFNSDIFGLLQQLRVIPSQ